MNSILRAKNCLQKNVTEPLKILAGIEVRVYMLIGGLANRAQLGPGSLQELDAFHKAADGPGFIQEAGSSVDYKLRNSGDGRREDGAAERHRFHQSERDSLAVAGENDEIGPAIERRQLTAGHVAQEFDFTGQIKVANQAVEAPMLRAFSGDAAAYIVSRCFERRACANQKCVILDGM